MVGFLRTLGGGDPRPESNPKVATLDAIREQTGHKFGDPDYVLPEFNRIVKRAYFDYQRDKVLFRTNPAVRTALRRIRRAAPSYKVDRETTAPRPAACPQCGADALRTRGDLRKMLVELRTVRGGLKRWVTLDRAKSCRCRQCGHEALP